jgi:uncharacterized protein
VHATYKARAAEVPFHGWGHVEFVMNYAGKFAPELGADAEIAETAALLHDLNYLALSGDAPDGSSLRATYLQDAGYAQAEVSLFEAIVNEARTAKRHADISPEAKALSDADTVFKSLPTTPLLALDYLAEGGGTLRELAQKIAAEQVPLEAQGIYFYAASAQEQFGDWGRENIRLWTRVKDALELSAVRALVAEAHPGISTDSL